jgi:GNAT superfamily N-acetyltransferase
MIEVRALAPDQWSLIREVRLRSLADAPGAFTSSYEREAAFDEATWRSRAVSCQWFVAFDADQPIGIAGGMDGWSIDSSERELVGMWVAPDRRGQGVAALLLGAVVGWARSQGATDLTLGVRQGNEGARAAYLKMGLELAGKTVVASGDPTIFIEVMRLSLSPAG